MGKKLQQTLKCLIQEKQKLKKLDRMVDVEAKICLEEKVVHFVFERQVTVKHKFQSSLKKKAILKNIFSGNGNKKLKFPSFYYVSLPSGYKKEVVLNSIVKILFCEMQLNFAQILFIS